MPGMRNRLTNELAICGFNAVAALAEHHGDEILRLFLREDRLPALSAFCRQLAEKRRPYKICDDEELERLCKSPRHQGVVAMVREPEIPPMAAEDLEAWAASGKTGLLLDSVGNDNNLGAIVRSAAFFGIDTVVLSSEDKEARLTTSAYRVAAGGMEHVKFRSVKDPAAFLKDAGKRLTVLGADHRARMRLRDLGAVLAERREGPAGKRGVVLVLGNEETGLSAQVKERCSVLVRIPGTGNVESLNVAQAATLFLHELFEL